MQHMQEAAPPVAFKVLTYIWMVQLSPSIQTASASHPARTEMQTSNRFFFRAPKRNAFMQ